MPFNLTINAVQQTVPQQVLMNGSATVQWDDPNPPYNQSTTTTLSGNIIDKGKIIYRVPIGGLDKSKIMAMSVAMQDPAYGDRLGSYGFSRHLKGWNSATAPGGEGNYDYSVACGGDKVRAPSVGGTSVPCTPGVFTNSPVMDGYFKEVVLSDLPQCPGIPRSFNPELENYWQGVTIRSNINSYELLTSYSSPPAYNTGEMLVNLNSATILSLLQGAGATTPTNAYLEIVFDRWGLQGSANFHYLRALGPNHWEEETVYETFTDSFESFTAVSLKMDYLDTVSGGFGNRNYPNTANTSILNTNNTTNTSLLLGKNCYFEKASAHTPATNIFFNKPTSRKQGMTDAGEWTRAKAGWFELAGEWVQFWPSATAATKKFFKLDMSTMGVAGNIEVVKVVPDYPYLWALLAVTPEGTFNSDSVIVKFNVENGTIDRHVTPQFSTGYLGHISDIFITANELFATGYMAPDQQTTPLNTNMAPRHRLAAKSSYDTALGLTALGSDNAFLDPVEGIVPIFKRYTKGLSLAYSRKIGAGSPVDVCYGKSLGYLKQHLNLSEDGSGNTLIVSASRKYEPKISVHNGYVYVFIPYSKNIGNQDFWVKQSSSDPGTTPELNLEQGVYCKKFKMNGDIFDSTTKEVCAFGESALHTDTGYKINFAKSMDHRDSGNTTGGRGYIIIDSLKDTTSAYRGFTKVYSGKCVSTGGTPGVVVYPDPDINGNNRLIFEDTFNFRSYQINPDFHSAFMAADSSFNYTVFTGNIDSAPGSLEMFISMHSKTDTFAIDCGFESQVVKTSSNTQVNFVDLNTTLTEDFGTWPNAPGYSPTVTSFFVQETPQDNGGNGWALTQVCNA